MTGAPIRNFIAGKWVDASGTETLPVDNPAAGQAIAQVPLSGLADVGKAVEAARKAFAGWRETPPVERARVLFRLKMLLEENLEDLGRNLTVEHGKIVRESIGEIRRGIENVEHACGIPTLM